MMDGEIDHKKLEIALPHSGKTMSSFFFFLIPPPFYFFTQTLHNVKKKKSQLFPWGLDFILHVAVVGGVTQVLGGWRIFGGSRIPRSVFTQSLSREIASDPGFLCLPTRFCG